MRAHLAEPGIVAAQGRDGIKELLKIIAGEADARLPVDAHTSLVVLAAELQAMSALHACKWARARDASVDRPQK